MQLHSLFLLILFLCNATNALAVEQSPLTQSQPTQSPPMCTSAVFQIIELKMNRTITLTIPIGVAVKHNTLLIQPESCITRTYAGDHTNTTTYTHVWTLPYRVMTEKKLPEAYVTPTLAFKGLMSTISPTFEHPSYAIIPIACKTEVCKVQPSATTDASAHRHQ